MRGFACVLICVAAAGCARRHAAPPTPPPPAVTRAQEPSKPAARKPRPRPARAPAPAPETTTPPAAAVGTIISAEQRSEYIRQIAYSLDQAARNLAAARARGLAEEGARTAATVDAFIRQAREAQATHDLITAHGLAERARVLSAGLAR